MLVLSRRKNETVVINEDIAVTVVEIREDRVRLGICAPADVPVHREELVDGWVVPLGQARAAPRDPEPDVPPRRPVRRPRFVELSVEQLVRLVGADPSEVNRQARFTSEGGIPPGPGKKRSARRGKGLT
jgi:carbon storage regulator